MPTTITVNPVPNLANLFSSTNELIFGAEPQQPNGTGNATLAGDNGTVTTDYVEAKVRYRL